jgi:hypothetical protein
MDAEHDIDADPPLPPMPVRDRDAVADDDLPRPEGQPPPEDAAADDRPPDHGDRPEAAADAPEEVRLGGAVDPRLTEAE